MELDGIVGRRQEAAAIARAVAEGSSLMIEGPVGVGKTRLALAVLRALARTYHRADGDGRYTKQKLTGWFDIGDWILRQWRPKGRGRGEGHAGNREGTTGP